jgi:putative alpha-1,2-mannosidase
LTQKWVRAICDDFYGLEPLRGYGVGQDEDQGQLGAWYVLAALGLFDVQGHAAMNPTFQLGSPLFDRARILLDPTYYEGSELIVETKNNGKQKRYIQSVQFNGQPVADTWILRSALMKGGTLQVELGETPNTAWGVGTPPPSMSTEKQ